MVCSFCVFVGVMMGDQTVLAYSSVGLVVALYVAVSVSFDFPQCVVVSVFSILLQFLAFSVVFVMCLEKFSFGSKVSPSILGSFVVGSSELSMCMERVVLYSAGSGVKSVVVVLVGFRVR